MDLENLCQRDGPLIKKMPTEDQFQKMVERLGISSDDDVVIYDTQGLYSAARAWFMFRVFNKNVKVHVMNGGLVRWTTEAYPLEKGKYELPSKKGSFALNPDYSLICSMNEVNQRVRDYKGGLTKRTVVDMRKPCCYHGTCPRADREPAEGAHSGQREHPVLQHHRPVQQLHDPQPRRAAHHLREARRDGERAREDDLQVSVCARCEA